MSNKCKTVRIKTKVGAEDLVVEFHWNNIIGTVIKVWKREDKVLNDHGGAWSYDMEGGPHVRVGTDPDSSSYRNLPVGSEKRSAEVNRVYELRRGVAYEAIKSVFALPANTQVGMPVAKQMRCRPYLDGGEYREWNVLDVAVRLWCTACDRKGWLNGNVSSATPCRECNGTGRKELFANAS
jgi:hypothetical protein